MKNMVNLRSNRHLLGFMIFSNELGFMEKGEALIRVRPKIIQRG